MIHLNEQKYEYLEEINEGILRCVPPVGNGVQLVLDVGCGSGALSEAIKDMGYRVFGIESNPDACSVASRRIDKAIEADLQDIDKVKHEVDCGRFDIIVFSDVLEHLYDPFITLKSYLDFLKPGGLVLISLPNAAVWSNRLRLLMGNFDYDDTGVRDRTHIRFFTFKSAKQMVEVSGCNIVKVDFTPYLVRAFLPLVKRFYTHRETPEKAGDRQILDSRGYRLYSKFVYPAEKMIAGVRMQFFAFRIIIVGRKYA